MIIFIVYSLGFIKLCHVIFTSVYIMFTFYAFQWRYYRHWKKTWWNIFTCFLQDWFWIHPFFYQRFKISINNKWCFIRLPEFMKLQYLSVFRRYYNITKIFIFTLIFIQINFFCSKKMKTIQAIKITIIFWCNSS